MTAALRNGMSFPRSASSIIIGRVGLLLTAFGFFLVIPYLLLGEIEHRSWVKAQAALAADGIDLNEASRSAPLTAEENFCAAPTLIGLGASDRTALGVQGKKNLSAIASAFRLRSDWWECRGGAIKGKPFDFAQPVATFRNAKPPMMPAGTGDDARDLFETLS